MSARPRFRVVPNRHWGLRFWVPVVTLCFYLLLSLAVFFAFQRSDTHEHRYRIGADSDTYFRIADFIREGTNGELLIGVSGNLLGPVAVALLLKTETLITFFNIALFLLAIYAAGTIFGVDRWFFALLLMLNAETFTSLITLNKEIFALLSASLFAKYVYSTKRSLLLLAVVLVTALFARWEQTAIVLLYLFLVNRRAFGIHKPLRRILTAVLMITLLYPLAAARVDLSGFDVQAIGGGTISVLNAMQTHFLFPLAVLPKILLNVAGQLVTPGYYFSNYLFLDPSDIQNRFAIQLHTIALCALFLVFYLRRRWQLREPLVFFAWLYMIVTAVTPFVQPRYQYPVYVLLSLELARDRFAAFHAYAAMEPAPQRPKRFCFRALPVRFRLHAPGLVPQARSPGQGLS